MTIPKAEEVIEALTDYCRFIAGHVCRKHGCGAKRESPDPGGKGPRWRCLMSGEYMSTARDRRRIIRHAERLRQPLRASGQRSELTR